MVNLITTLESKLSKRAIVFLALTPLFLAVAVVLGLVLYQALAVETAEPAELGRPSPSEVISSPSGETPGPGWEPRREL